MTLGDLILAASTAKGIHLQYDSVTGSPSAVHANHITMTSFQFGVGIAPPPPTRGTPGRPNLRHHDDQADRQVHGPLLNKLFRAAPVLRATIYFTDVNAGGAPFDYLEFDLRDAFITGFSMSSGGDLPSESLSLNYSRLTIIAHIPGAAAQTVTHDIPSNTST